MLEDEFLICPTVRSLLWQVRLGELSMCVLLGRKLV